ncbi:hypothetical protein GCM10027610_080100 [Dactylosporangium cerinum]
MSRAGGRTAGETVSQIAGISGGTGLIYLGQQLGGHWGTTLTYLSPVLSWALGYGLFRWNSWSDQRTKQRALRDLEKEIEGYLNTPDITEQEKQDLRKGLADLKLHAGRLGIERVRLLLNAPSPAAAPRLDFQTALSGMSERRSESAAEASTNRADVN